MTDLADWVTLWRVPGIGAVTFHTLLEQFGTPGEILKASASQLKSAGLKPAIIADLKRPNEERVDLDLRWQQESNHHIVTLKDEDYPPKLREIGRPPPLLYITGELGCLKDPQVAIVGSRHPTPGGLENAESFTKFLTTAGLTITSGLALGIDAVAHKTALANGGISIAVAATGLDRVYPAMHRELAHRIAAQGAIVSEFPLGTQVKAQHFPQRNRIISGLSLGTLVVEAAHRSGSLITARFAAEQGRDVFALPGSIHNPLAKGCHKLIRQGATLVENPQDILEQLANQIELSEEHRPSIAAETDTSLTLDEDYRLVLDTLGHDPTSIDTIVERSALTSEAVSSMLLILELNGYVASTTGGLYVRLGKEYSE